MSSDSSDKEYWDACIFITWLNNQPRIDPNDNEGVKESAFRITHNKVHLYTSVITIAEVLHGDLTPEQTQTFRDIFKRKNVHLVQLNRTIADMAAEIRNHYRMKRANGNEVVMKLPDAVHLATAIIMDCGVFYTFDGSGCHPKPFALIPLNGTIAGKYPLLIKKPEPTPPPKGSLLELAMKVSEGKDNESG